MDAVPQVAAILAWEPPDTMKVAWSRFCISGEYISLPPEAVNVLYDAGEIVIVTSRFLKRRASTVKIVRLRLVSALI